MMKKNTIWTVRKLITGALAGGILGAALVFLLGKNVSVIPGFKSILAISPFNRIITGTAIGIIIGGSIAGLTGNASTDHFPPSKKLLYDPDRNQTLQIREEKLDIAKKPIQTGEVTLHKERFTEEKTITVPVTREELVIEKKTFNKKHPDKAAEQTEAIRIPLSEEQVEVGKHTEFINDVSVYKNKFQVNERVQETVKKEKVYLETTGSPRISDKKP